MRSQPTTKIDLRRGDFEGMHPKAKLFGFDEDKKLYTGDGVESINHQWTTWCACIGMLHLEVKEAQAVPEWISVGDSLPPVDETVLVCWDYAADIEPEKEYLTLDEDYNEYWPNCQDEPPTHWLPLPKVIKAQEKANEL